MEKWELLGKRDEGSWDKDNSLDRSLGDLRKLPRQVWKLNDDWKIDEISTGIPRGLLPSLELNENGVDPRLGEARLAAFACR